MADEAALAPLAIVEELRQGEQDAGVVGPHLQRLVAVVLGLLNETAQAPLRVGAELGADRVGRVDVQAMESKPASRAVDVECQIQQRYGKPVVGHQKIPIRRHGLKLDRVRVVCPGTQFSRSRIHRIGESAEGDLLQAHVSYSSTSRAGVNLTAIDRAWEE